MKIDIGNDQVITIVDGACSSTLLDEIIDPDNGLIADDDDEDYAAAINIMEHTLFALASDGLIVESDKLNECIRSLVENFANQL